MANIPVSGTEMTPGSVYFCLSAGKKHAPALIDSICNRNDAPHLIGLCSPEDLFRGYDDDAEQLLEKCLSEKCKRVHFWHDPEQKIPATASALLRDLKKMSPAKPALYIIFIKASAFPSDQHPKLNNVLAAWQKWARKYNHSVLFLCHGEIKTLESAALHSNSYLSGLTSFYALDASHYRYFIHFWGSSNSVVADQEYLLVTNTVGSLEAMDIPAEHTAHSDFSPDSNVSNGGIYTTTSIANEISSELQVSVSVASNNLIMNSIEELGNATVIFACASPSEVVELATMTYQLRSRYKHKIKILIRENVQCLRYADEEFLLKAGASQIIPYIITTTRLISQIEAIRGDQLRRKLPPTLYGLLESRQTSDYRGYAEPHTFAATVGKTMDAQRYSGIEHILVRFEPLRGITMEQSLNLCHIKRDGDLITVCRGFIYIFLHACRLNNVAIALKNSLLLPVQDSFGSQSIIHDADDIIAELELIDLSTDGIPADIGQKLLASNPEKNQKNGGNKRISVTLANPYVINQG
nr:BcsE family c-di-GMP-binding protein [Marortus sp. BJYM1]